VTLAGPIHGDVAVALQQAHQPADPAEQLALVRAGQQGGNATLVERIGARAQILDHPTEGVEKPLGVGIDGVERLLDQ
jgi:hypothetical protein